MKLNNLKIDWLEVNAAHYTELEDLRQTMWNRIMAMQVKVQNDVVQEVLDNGENIDDYNFHETYWWEDNIYHYKFWKEKKHEN